MRILLLTDVPPCKDYTAGIFLEQLISLIPVNSVACFTILNRELGPITSTTIGLYQEKVVEKIREDWGKTSSKWGRYLSWSMEHLYSLREIPRLIEDVYKFGKQVNAEILWCVLQGQTMIRLARPVADKLKIPLLTNVWDPPSWWMRANKVHPAVSNRVIKEFGEVAYKSAAMGTASWAMAKEYNTLYDANTIPFLPSLPSEIAFSPALAPNSSKDFSIGLAGQIYAVAEWNALIRALDTVDWRIAGREVRIRLLGRWAGLSANTQMNVEFLGWHSQEKTTRLLSEVDILYCPYWFNPEYRDEARLSFPSKLTTYLAAGRPVLFHGPEYASPARFLEDRHAGECCYSLDPEVIIGSLTKLAVDKDHYSEIAFNGHNAFIECLTLPFLKNNFLQFLAAAK